MFPTSLNLWPSLPLPHSKVSKPAPSRWVLSLGTSRFNYIFEWVCECRTLCICLSNSLSMFRQVVPTVLRVLEHWDMQTEGIQIKGREWHLKSEDRPRFSWSLWLWPLKVQWSLQLSVCMYVCVCACLLASVCMCLKHESILCLSAEKKSHHKMCVRDIDPNQEQLAQMEED